MEKDVTPDLLAAMGAAGRAAGEAEAEQWRQAQQIFVRFMQKQGLAKIAAAGGPITLIRAAERDAARKAGDEEADLWLHALTRGGLSDGASAETIADWVKALRRRLKVKPPIEEVRAKTRARVRRHRERAKGKRISPEAAL